MERTKKCRYCSAEFKAKRIDAKYCSDSCRQMSYRRQSDPHTYGKVVPIYFELDADVYAEVLKKADSIELHPNEYIKQMVADDEFELRVPFTNSERAHLNTARLKYKDVSAEILIRYWINQRLKKEFDNWDGSVDYNL